MAGQRVLQIGMDPGVIDFSPYPGQDADQLQARVDAAEAALRDAGFEVTSCQMPDDPDATESLVRSRASGAVFDAVEIGSGLRTSHDYTVILERVVDAVAELAPGIRFCFNDSPESTLSAVRRAVTR